jgi:O-antigen ligase
MSASLGSYLTICFWAAWMLGSTSGRKARMLIAPLLVVMAAGVYFTYTRSTWLGLAGGLAVVPLLQLPPRWRPALGIAMLGAVVAGGLLLGGKVASMGRDDNNGSAEHSVYQRASFTYVSLKMFQDAPLFGHGFGRFYDKKLPYLSDRKQQIELESIRQLDHHITPLGFSPRRGWSA